MNQHITIIGAGGFAREVLCLIIDIWKGTDNNYKKQVKFAEPDIEWCEREIMGVPVIPQSSISSELSEVIIGIGSPALRQKVVAQLPKNTRFATLIHPNVIVSEWVEIGEGSVICAGSILTCNIKIGKHAHLNLHTTIGHDFQAGDFLTTAPAVNVSGICAFGNRVYLGTNCSIKQGINICDDVTIGMGAVVVKSIEEQGVYIGNPLKKLDKN